MKVGELKAQVRAMRVNPAIPLVVPGVDKVLWVRVQKASLLEQLDTVFLTKADFCGMTLVEDRITPLVAKQKPAPEPEPEEDDEPLSGEITISTITLTADSFLDHDEADDLLAGDDDSAEDLLA